MPFSNGRLEFILLILFPIIFFDISHTVTYAQTISGYANLEFVAASDAARSARVEARIATEELKRANDALRAVLNDAASEAPSSASRATSLGTRAATESSWLSKLGSILKSPFTRLIGGSGGGGASLLLYSGEVGAGSDIKTTQTPEQKLQSWRALRNTTLDSADSTGAKIWTPERKALWNDNLAACKKDNGGADCDQTQSENYYAYNKLPYNTSPTPNPAPVGGQAGTSGDAKDYPPPSTATKAEPATRAPSAIPASLNNVPVSESTTFPANQWYGTISQCADWYPDDVAVYDSCIRGGKAGLNTTNLSGERSSPIGGFRSQLSKDTNWQEQLDRCGTNNTCRDNVLNALDKSYELPAKGYNIDTEYQRILRERYEGDPDRIQRAMEEAEGQGVQGTFRQLNAATEAGRLQQPQTQALENVVPPGYWDPNGPYARGADDKILGQEPVPPAEGLSYYTNGISNFFSSIGSGLSRFFGGGGSTPTSNESSVTPSTEPFNWARQYPGGYPGTTFRGKPIDAYGVVEGDEPINPLGEPASLLPTPTQGATEIWWTLDDSVQPTTGLDEDLIGIQPGPTWTEVLTPITPETQGDPVLDQLPPPVFEPNYQWGGPDDYDNWPWDQGNAGPTRQYSVAVPFSEELFNQSLVASAFGAFLLKSK